jgi:hypothetical protein
VVPFLPGAYGAIITQVTCFDFPWVIWRLTHNNYGLNLADEINDADTQRVGNGLCLPISKRVAGLFAAGTVGAGLGSVSFVLLPSNWSVMPDPVSSSYIFRDDFMESALDTGVWTIGQSVPGNIAIDPTYQWCRMFGTSGSGAWVTNAMFKTASIARAEGRAMVIDVFTPLDSTSGFGGVGWTGGGPLGGSYQSNNFPHCLNFAASNVLNVYEDGTLRGTVGSGYSYGTIYRVRITLHSAGNATYEIQGGPEYPAIGSASWTDITPGTSSSAINVLYPGIAAYNGHGYVSDVRVY